MPGGGGPRAGGAHGVRRVVPGGDGGYGRIPAGVVLCVGQAAGRSAVTPERVAINVDDARDPGQRRAAAGRCAHRPRADRGVFRHGTGEGHGPAIREAGVPSELSNSAGHMCATTCCTAYCTMQVRESGRGSIHVPCIPEQTAGTDRPSLPLAQLVAALEAAVAACCKG